MRRLLAILLLGSLTFFQAPLHAQERYYSQAELDALLAPVALYPDTLLAHILVAATYPDDVREAAAWSRANAHLRGEDAVRAAEPMPWHPSLKALLAFPDLLARMDESPRWTEDLGAAYLAQQAEVMGTVQALRYRAQASGVLQQPEYRYLVQPVQAEVVYVPYYNPLIVYGTWWHSHRPVVWRPWHPRPPVHITNVYAGRPQHRHYRQREHAFPRPHSQARLKEFKTVPKLSYQPRDTKPVAPAARPHARFERRELRHERRESRPAVGSPISARLSSSFRGKSHDYRDAGGRHPGGARGNAPHSRRKN